MASTSFADTEKATFGGGCFWCLEPPFESIHGVISVVSGYAGGSVPNPTYAQVTSGQTGHIEVVEITFDPRIVDYQTLLDTFWRQVDPTDAGGQFVDRGPQYRTVIFTHSEHQNALAHESKDRLNKAQIFESPIVTEILPAPIFYEAEDYQQDYYKKYAAVHVLSVQVGSRPSSRIILGPNNQRSGRLIRVTWKRSRYRKPSMDTIRSQTDAAPVSSYSRRGN